jgi:gliding motility-associated-like protein
MLALQVGDRQICIGGEVVLSTEVTGGTAPYFFYWIDLTNSDTVFTNEITVHPTVTSNYHFYAEDAQGCTSNVVNSTVNVYPSLTLLSLTVDKDSICEGEGININLDVEGGNGGPYQILLLNTSQIVASPFTIYPMETTTYTIQIKDQCSTPAVEASFDIVVMPDPPIGFNVDYRESCPPGIFSFVEFSPNLGQSYMWNFGDTQFSIDKNPVHTYTDAGEYDVSLIVTSDFGCKKTLSIENLIEIHNKPDAEFYVDKNHASILDPIIQFFNVSSYADSIFWYFGDGDSTLFSHENPWHEFEAIGLYNVKMVAENSHGCIDTTYKKIRIVDEYTFNAPDVFTPNNDGVNDCFRLCAHGIDVHEFEFYIYDRFGSIVYETSIFENDKPCVECGEGSWDGTYNGSYTKGDVLCESGMYAWYCVYQDVAGVDNVARGVVTLMR